MFWYGLEALKARTVGERERAMTRQEPEHEHTSLEIKVEQMLTEARVILPGAQALLGFQLVITFSEAFEKLPFTSKIMHLIALGLLALTVIWLMAPAAFHRIVYAGEDTSGFHALGTRFLLAASVTLALGISADLGVVVAKVTASGWGASSPRLPPSPSGRPLARLPAHPQAAPESGLSALVSPTLTESLSGLPEADQVRRRASGSPARGPCASRTSYWPTASDFKR